MNKSVELCLNQPIQENKKVRFSPYLLWAFAIPAILFLGIYFMRGVYPIAENSVLVLDLNAQYVYFFEELRDVLLGEGSLLYSWQRALGGEFMGIFAYYIASPFNLLIALFPENSITEALLTIFVLKAGLSGFNFAVYLHYSKRAKNKFATVIFSTMYALCSYALVNGHNTMWIDALLFLPLIVLSIENLINKKKYIMYTILLAITVISNFYIGYMVCLFVILYSFYYYFAYGYSPEYNESGEKLHFLKSFLRVLFFSLIALAMSAVILFTIYYSLKFGKNEFSDPSYSLKSKFDLIDLFAKMLPNYYDTVRPEGITFVYCGTLSIIMLPIFFFTKKITAREKIWAGSILSVLVLTFSASTLDIFWHGLQNPNWLNYRYSFMLCFLMVVFAHQAFTFIREINFNHIVAVCAVLVILIVMVQKEEYKFIDSVLCIWVSLICIAVYLIALHAHHKEKSANFTSAILAIIVCTELVINGYVNLDGLDNDVVFSSRTSYRSYIDKLEPIVEYVQEQDSSFYRMEKTTHRKTNDNMTLNMNGLTNSTSTLNTPIITLLNQLGYSSKSHWSKYLGGTPASDSILGLKYIISDNEDAYPLMNKIYQDGDYYVYENPYALSLAFGVSENFKHTDFSSYVTPFELMNAMVSDMLGESETIQLFKPIQEFESSTSNAIMSYVNNEYFKYTPQNKNSKARVNYTFAAPTTDEIFFFYPSEYPREVALYLNSRDWGTFFANETDRIVTLESYDAGDTVKLTVELKSENLFLIKDQNFFWYMDSEVYKDVMARLNESRYEIEEHSDTYLSGNITIQNNDTLLFTSIPYDEGWHIICDGKELPLTKTANSLLAATIPVGTHKLEFKYLPDCFVQGALIAGSGAVLFTVIICVDLIVRKLKKKKNAELKLQRDDFYDDLKEYIPDEFSNLDFEFTDIENHEDIINSSAKADETPEKESEDYNDEQKSTSEPENIEKAENFQNEKEDLTNENNLL